MSLSLGTWLSHLAVISVVGMYNKSSKNSHVQIRAAKTLMQWFSVVPCLTSPDSISSKHFYPS